MMQLKNIIIETDSVAKELLKNWNYDENSIHFWRASANYIYIFTHNSEKYYLRFVQEEDNTVEQIESELEFLAYLNSNNYPCAYAIESKNRRYIETITVEEGSFYGVVFKEAKGNIIDIEELSELQAETWGKTLGVLHNLSINYNPNKYSRQSYKDKLQFIQNVLSDFPEEKEALAELKRVDNWLSSLPVTKDNYGLIHYDFELDNVLLNKVTNTFTAIDFDDSIYHWYVMDIVCALRDLKELEEEQAESKLNSFLKGYSLEKSLPSNLTELMPRFERYLNLYMFSRLLRAMKNNNYTYSEEWLVGLKIKLTNYCNHYREGFKKPW